MFIFQKHAVARKELNTPQKVRKITMRREHIVRFLKAVLVLVFFLFSASAWALTVDDITYMTEDYPPFNMAGTDGVATGAAVDVMTGIFERMGSSKTAKDIQVLPWARGYREVQNTPNTCLFLMTLTDERKPMFKWVGPVAPTKVSVLALKSKGLKITSASDLADLKAGVVRDDIGDTLAQKAGVKHIERVPSNDQNVKKMNEGRIDIWVFEESVAKWQIEKFGFNVDDYESVWVLSESDLYYAFHKDVDDALIEAMQKVLDAMKADGSYEAIMKKYNVQ